MNKVILTICAMLCLFSTSYAGVTGWPYDECFDGMTHPGPEYHFESLCEVDRQIDFLRLQTYNTSCFRKGILFYTWYYCLKNQKASKQVQTDKLL